MKLIANIETRHTLQKIPGIKTKAYCERKLGNIKNIPAIIKHQIKNSSIIPDNYVELAELYVNLGRAYANIGNKKNALKSLYKAEQLFNITPGVSGERRVDLCY
jgi:hypothetical protein